MDNTDLQNQNPTVPQNTPLQTDPAVTPAWQSPVTPEPVSPPVAPVAPQVPPTPVVEASSPWQAAPVTPPANETPITPAWQTATTPPPAESTPLASSPLTPTPATTSVPLPTAEEPPLPTKKKGIPPVITGVLAMFFVAGIAGGTFLLSRGVNTTAPIAPNAPASEPKAFDPSEEAASTIITPGEVDANVTPGFDPNGTVDCTDVPNTAPYGNRCVPVITTSTGEVVWAPGALESL